MCEARRRACAPRFNENVWPNTGQHLANALHVSGNVPSGVWAMSPLRCTRDCKQRRYRRSFSPVLWATTLTMSMCDNWLWHKEKLD